MHASAHGRTEQRRAQPAGSLGAHWPPRFEPHNVRIKAFAPFLIGSMASLDRLRDRVEAVERENPGSLRTTVRAFMERGMLEGLRPTGDLNVEAVLPADAIFPGHVLVYLGRNKIARMPDPSALEQELDAIQSIGQMPAVPADAAMRRIRQAGYEIGILEDLNGHLDAMLALYNEAYTLYTFDITAQTIPCMFEGGNRVMAAIDRDGSLASAMVAEHASVLVDGKEVSLFELSDYATFRSHRGNGLMTAMQIEMIRTLRQADPGSMIFAEDRASWTPVNISSQKAGMVYAGTLLKHCRLNADRDMPESGDFENLNVWYAPGGRDD